jgi:hypothetical protein
MRLHQLTEAKDETKYGIIRYPDTAISYIKNDGNGWEHIFDKSYGFEGPVDKEDLQYAKKIAKEKIPSRMFESSEMMTEEPIEEEKQRLDPKCWDGYKIGNPKTKMKGGKRVNNCVPK